MASVELTLRRYKTTSIGTHTLHLEQILALMRIGRGAELATTEIVAMFAYDNKVMRDILLGLGGGLFAKRRFEMDYDAQRIKFSVV